jgi:hypothetical protein
MESTRVIASGNLATQQRTITGVMGQFVQMEVPDREALHIVLNAGLPASALDAPAWPRAGSPLPGSATSALDLAPQLRPPSTGWGW